MSTAMPHRRLLVLLLLAATCPGSRVKGQEVEFRPLSLQCPDGGSASVLRHDDRFLYGQHDSGWFPDIKRAARPNDPPPSPSHPLRTDPPLGAYSPGGDDPLQVRGSGTPADVSPGRPRRSVLTATRTRFYPRARSGDYPRRREGGARPALYRDSVGPSVPVQRGARRAAGSADGTPAVWADQGAADAGGPKARRDIYSYLHPSYLYPKLNTSRTRRVPTNPSVTPNPYPNLHPSPNSNLTPNRNHSPNPNPSRTPTPNPRAPSDTADADRQPPPPPPRPLSPPSGPETGGPPPSRSSVPVTGEGLALDHGQPGTRRGTRRLVPPLPHSYPGWPTRRRRHAAATRGYRATAGRTANVRRYRGPSEEARPLQVDSYRSRWNSDDDPTLRQTSRPDITEKKLYHRRRLSADNSDLLPPEVDLMDEFLDYSLADDDRTSLFRKLAVVGECITKAAALQKHLAPMETTQTWNGGVAGGNLYDDDEVAVRLPTPAEEAASRDDKEGRREKKKEGALGGDGTGSQRDAGRPRLAGGWRRGGRQSNHTGGAGHTPMDVDAVHDGTGPGVKSPAATPPPAPASGGLYDNRMLHLLSYCVGTSPADLRMTDLDTDPDLDLDLDPQPLRSKGRRRRAAWGRRAVEREVRRLLGGSPSSPPLGEAALGSALMLAELAGAERGVGLGPLLGWEPRLAKRLSFVHPRCLRPDLRFLRAADNIDHRLLRLLKHITATPPPPAQVVATATGRGTQGLKAAPHPAHTAPGPNPIPEGAVAKRDEAGETPDPIPGASSLRGKKSKVGPRPGPGLRLRVGVGSPLPWACPSRTRWRDLGLSVFPRYVQETSCATTTGPASANASMCWYGVYTCQATTSAVQVLVRHTGNCNDSRVPENIRRHYFLSVVSISTGCACL